MCRRGRRDWINEKIANKLQENECVKFTTNSFKGFKNDGRIKLLITVGTRPEIIRLAAVINIDNNNNMTVGYIDKTGHLRIDATLPYYGISGVDEDPFVCSEGMIRTVKNFNDEESDDYLLKYGFVDNKGNLVVPYKFTDAHDFSGGLAAVCDNEGKWGFIDKGGNIIIPFKYDGVSWNSFQDGFALVMIGDKYGYVDKQGNDTFSVK